MYPAVGVEDVAARSIREDDHPLGEVSARPVGSSLSRKWGRVAVDPERVQAAIAVQDESAGAVGQESEVPGDVPARPVHSAGHRDRRAIRIQASLAIEYETGLGRGCAGKSFSIPGDAPPRPGG